MNGDIIRQIEKMLPEMTGAQKRVALYILEEPMETAFSTIDKIAHAAEVSTTSVIRLANTLGYGAFSEFQRAMKEYLRAYSAPVNKFSLNTRDGEPGQEGAGIAADVYRHELENMSSALQGLREDTLEAVAHRLDGARHIYICGARTSESVARYLAFDLGRMFFNVSYVGESPTEQLELFKQIGPEDVLVAITMFRYNRTVCNAATYCKELGIPVIALVDSHDSPLVGVSEYQLVAKCDSNAFHNSIAAQIFLCDVIIKECSLVSEERVRINLKRDEEIIAEMQYFVRQ